MILGKRLPYKYNLHRSVEKDTDKMFYSHVKLAENIPKSADLRSNYSEIKDQKNLGACTSFSACSVLEYLLDKNVDLSELYFYYKEREKDGSVLEDSGSTIARSAEVATEIGTCIEALEPYIVENFTNKPGDEANIDAKNHKALTKYRLKTINEILYSIGVERTPVLIGCQVFESMELVGKDGYVPMPAPYEQYLGAHAINLCGYFYKKKSICDKVKSIFNDDKYDGLYFIGRNSWSKEYGHNGYMYLPVGFIREYSSDWWQINIK